MKSLSVSLLLLILSVGGLFAAEEPGNVKITVTYAGEIPTAKVKDEKGVRRELIHVDKKSRGLRFAACYLTPAEGEALAAPKVDAQKLPVVEVNQKDLTFVPHVIAVREGQRVRFSNSDFDNHNVRAASLDARNVFNTFTPTDGSYQHRFFADRKNRPINIGCSIHPWMQAWVFVFEHPWHAVTNPQGQAALSGIPPGKYRLVIVQPDIGAKSEKAIIVQAGKTLALKFEFTAKDVKNR